MKQPGKAAWAAASSAAHWVLALHKTVGATGSYILSGVHDPLPGLHHGDPL